MSSSLILTNCSRTLSTAIGCKFTLHEKGASKSWECLTVMRRHRHQTFGCLRIICFVYIVLLKMSTTVVVLPVPATLSEKKKECVIPGAPPINDLKGTAQDCTAILWLPLRPIIPSFSCVHVWLLYISNTQAAEVKRGMSCINKCFLNIRTQHISGLLRSK